MLLNQVALCCDQYWAAEGIQVGVVQLVGHAVDGVRGFHMDVSMEAIVSTLSTNYNSYREWNRA